MSTDLDPYATISSPAYIERALASEALDEAHQSAFRRAVQNVLYTDIAEITFAQIISGLPLADVALHARGPTLHEAIVNHKSLDPENLRKAKILREEFDPLDLEIQVEVLQRYENHPAGSKASRLHLIELVAVAIHRIAVLIYKMGNSLKERGLEEDQLCSTLRRGPDEQLHPTPYPTPFVLYEYAEVAQYQEEGVAELPGYWAENQIFGGVIVFDRGENGTECRSVWLHPFRKDQDHRLSQINDNELSDLMRFFTSEASQTSSPLPILVGMHKIRRRATMMDRKVIYDSEDDDAGFSPLNSPSKYDATSADVTTDATGQPQQGLDISEMRSTDPDFFRKFYDEQQEVVAELVPDSAGGGNRNTGSSDRQKSSGRNAKDNSSSLTDPTSKTAKKRLSRVDRADLASLTQVTTPRNAAPSFKDIYDFPSSNEGDAAETNAAKGKAKVTKTTSKRKRGELVTSAKADVSSSPAHPSSQEELMPTRRYFENASRGPTRKKRKSGIQQSLAQIPEDVDLLVIPRTAGVDESPAEARVDNEDLGGVVPDTLKDDQSVIEHPPASFFIAPPSRLTASQKQEYVRISGSSDHEREGNHETSLPVPQAQTQLQQIRSSEATIAYTTPSIYCSTPHFPELQDAGDRGSSGTTGSIRKMANNTGAGAILPHSSPDELGSDSPNQPLSRPKHRRGGDEDDELAQGDAWDSDEIGIAREQYVPRPSRRRADNDPDDIFAGPQLAGDSGSAKKRLKTGRHSNVAQEDAWDSDKIGAHRETYKPRPSRRRSRAVVQEDEEEIASEQSMPDTCPPRPVSSGDMEGAEPVLISSGQQAPREESEGIEGIDPDYLAALPKELRQEVISDHLARNAQSSRTRGRGRPSQPVNTVVSAAEETPQPKKKGRKKKEPISEEPLAAAQHDDADATPASLAPAKRKRGRPKKSEVVQLEPAAATDEDISFAYEIEDIPQATDESAAEEIQPAEVVQEAPVPAKAPSKRGRRKKVVEEVPTALDEEPTELDAEEVSPNEPMAAVSETAKAPSKRGRKKKVVEEPPAAIADEPEDEGDTAQGLSMEVEEADASRTPLQDISNTSPSKEKEVTPEAKAKGAPKSASSTTGQGQGKVPLRVGLSKRSRIAPLLKVIRK